jgi:hypothetical protein
MAATALGSGAPDAVPATFHGTTNCGLLGLRTSVTTVCRKWVFACDFDLRCVFQLASRIEARDTAIAFVNGKALKATPST